jgi:hypothetical protein
MQAGEGLVLNPPHLSPLPGSQGDSWLPQMVSSQPPQFSSTNLRQKLQLLVATKQRRHQGSYQLWNCSAYIAMWKGWRGQLDWKLSCPAQRTAGQDPFFLFFFLVGLGFELRAFAPAKQILYCLSHTSSLFCSGYFLGDGISQTIFPELASNQNPPNLRLPSS